MSDNELNQMYHDESWGELAEKALKIEPCNVEMQARTIARYAAERLNKWKAVCDWFEQHGWLANKKWPDQLAATCETYGRCLRDLVLDAIKTQKIDSQNRGDIDEGQMHLPP